MKKLLWNTDVNYEPRIVGTLGAVAIVCDF